MTKEQFKSFTTKKMRVSLHYRLRLVAAAMNCTMEQAFDMVLENGLGLVEKSTQQTVRMPGEGSDEY